MSGRHTETVTSQLLQKTGISKEAAHFVDNGISMIGTLGGSAAIRSSQAAAFPKYSLPPAGHNISQKDLNLSRGAYSVNAGINLNKKLSQLENIQFDAVKKRVLPDGRVRYYTKENLSKSKGPTSGACQVVEWNPLNSHVRSWYECHDHFGQINRVHPKQINGQELTSPHYPPTAKELY